MRVAMYVWHRWFAWYPVLPEGEGFQGVWLETVERRLVGRVTGYLFGTRPVYEYRELPPEPDVAMGTGA